MLWHCNCAVIMVASIGWLKVGNIISLMSRLFCILLYRSR